MRLPALYIRGRIVVGNSHSAAFDQLSQDERSEDSISSGVFDPDTGEFQGYLEDEHFYEKEIVLIRHAEVDDDGPDPGISECGVEQVQNVIPYLRQLDLSQFVCRCSPMLRCLETACEIYKHLGIRFYVDPYLLEPPSSLKFGDSYYIRSRCQEFPDYQWGFQHGWLVEYINGHDFARHVGNVLRSLPQKSIIITHSGFVISMARLALCENTVLECGVPTASLTHIENRKVRCLGKAT